MKGVLTILLLVFVLAVVSTAATGEHRWRNVDAGNSGRIESANCWRFTWHDIQNPTDARNHVHMKWHDRFTGRNTTSTTITMVTYSASRDREYLYHCGHGQRFLGHNRYWLKGAYGHTRDHDAWLRMDASPGRELMR